MRSRLHLIFRVRGSHSALLNAAERPHRMKARTLFAHSKTGARPRYTAHSKIGARPRYTAHSHKQRGSVFVVSLAVVAGLVAILASIAASQRVAVRASINRMEARRAELAAQSGIQRALAEFSSQDPNLTTHQDPWAILSVGGEDQFIVGRESFRIEIVDSSSTLDLNSVDETQLLNLPMTTEQIDSLLDWRSGERDPRPEGAKDEFYNNLLAPYNAKLGAFDSLSELLLVRGFTPQSLYEVQTDIVNTGTTIPGSVENQPVLAELLGTDTRSASVGPTGQTLLNVNGNNVNVGTLIQRGFSAPLAMAILQRRPHSGVGSILSVPGVNQTNATLVLDNLTTSGAPTRVGRVNVNTASESVLAALPGMQADIASSIVARQPTGINSLGELLSVPGLSLQVLQQIVDRLTVNSQSFRVRVEGRAGKGRALYEATLVLEDGGARLLKVRRAPFSDMPARWGWVAEPSRDVIITELQ